MALTGCRNDKQKTRKYIILMIADGMGMADVVAARIYKNGVEPQLLDFERLENLGYASTFSKNSLITDSAAAGTALATGYKTNNGVISQTPEGTPVKSLMEAAEEK